VKGHILAVLAGLLACWRLGSRAKFKEGTMSMGFCQNTSSTFKQTLYVAFKYLQASLIPSFIERANISVCI
jgi:hypothetical protein